MTTGPRVEDHVSVSTACLELSEIAAIVADPRAGATSTFSGTTRDNHFGESCVTDGLAGDKPRRSASVTSRVLYTRTVSPPICSGGRCCFLRPLLPLSRLVAFLVHGCRASEEGVLLEPKLWSGRIFLFCMMMGMCRSCCCRCFLFVMCHRYSLCTNYKSECSKKPPLCYSFISSPALPSEREHFQSPISLVLRDDFLRFPA